MAKRANWNKELGWQPVAYVCSRRGFAVEIGYNPVQENEYRWCVQFAGNGQYYQSAEKAVAYCLSRKWCKAENTDMLRRKILAEAARLTAGMEVAQ